MAMWNVSELRSVLFFGFFALTDNHCIKYLKIPVFTDPYSCIFYAGNFVVLKASSLRSCSNNCCVTANIEQIFSAQDWDVTGAFKFIILVNFFAVAYLIHKTLAQIDD